MDIEALGVSKEKLLEMVIEAAVAELMSSECRVDLSEMAARQYRETLKERVDVYVADKIAPMMDIAIANTVLKQTNRYGEETGKPITFLEYITQRAGEWFTEKVDYTGKTVESYNSSSGKPRIVFMIYQHLDMNIKDEVKKVISDTHKVLGKSIQDVIQQALESIKTSVTIETRAKS